MITKTFSNVTIKDADQGTVEAVFSTFGVKDHDGDVVLKGAISDGASVIISAYGHKSWDGHLPIGTGTIRVTDSEAILDGKFFIDTTHGRDAWSTVKAVSEAGLQQWSYSLEDIKSTKGTHDGQPARIIESVNITEVSPVLKGASLGTRTLSAKAAEVTKFSDCSDIALRGVRQLVEMATDRLTTRAAEGKSITEQTDAYDLLVVQVEELRKAIEATQEETPPNLDELAAQYARFIALTTGA